MGMGGPMGGPGMMMGGGAVDMKELANLQTDRLSEELHLSDQQYKKIYKITKKELDRRVNHYLSTGGSTGGFGGFGGFGGGFPMGGPGMGGPMGAPGMGGQGMNQNQEESKESAALRQAQAVYDRMEAMEQTKADLKAKIKIEKKMMKILDEGQYAKWVEIQSRPKPAPAPAPQMNGGMPNFENMPEEVRQRIMERMQQGGQGRPGAGPGAGPEGNNRRR